MSGVQAVDKVVAVLDAFTRLRTELGVAEVARESELTKTSAHRLLTSLVANGVVERSADGERYRLGPQLLRWAGVAQAQINLTQIAKPLMLRLRDDVGETVGLHILDGIRHRQVIDQVESRFEVRRTYTEIGQPILIHQGAPGKVLLAYEDPVDQEDVLAGELFSATSETLVDAATLRTELSAIRAQGYALSMQERVFGVGSMAVPVRDHLGRVQISISVSGPVMRVTAERLVEAVPMARRAADRLTELLGGRPAQ